MQWMVPAEEGCVGNGPWEPARSTETPVVPKPDTLPPQASPGTAGVPRAAVLTQRHDGEVFAPKLAGDFDFLAKRPTVLGVSMVGSSWRVVAHLARKGDSSVPATPSRPVGPEEQGWWYLLAEGAVAILLQAIQLKGLPKEGVEGFAGAEDGGGVG